MTKKELHDQILELVKNIVIHIITKKHNLNRETGSICVPCVRP